MARAGVGALGISERVQRLLKKGMSRTGIETAADACDAAVTLYRLPHPAVFDVLAAANLSAYDAEYVALAIHLGCKLVTTDRDVLKAFPKLAVRLQDFAAAD